MVRSKRSPSESTVLLGELNLGNPKPDPGSIKIHWDPDPDPDLYMDPGSDLDSLDWTIWLLLGISRIP